MRGRPRRPSGLLEVLTVPDDELLEGLLGLCARGAPACPLLPLGDQIEGRELALEQQPASLALANPAQEVAVHDPLHQRGSHADRLARSDPHAYPTRRRPGARRAWGSPTLRHRT